MAKNRVFWCFEAKTKHLLPSPSKIAYLFFSLTSAYSVPLWFVKHILFCSTRPQIARKQGIGFPSITSWLLNSEIRQDENRVR